MQLISAGTPRFGTYDRGIGALASGAKTAAAYLGRHTGASVIAALDTLLDHLGTGRMLRQHRLEPARSVRDRTDLFDLAIREAGSGSVVYLEFGVASGASMAYWSRELHNDRARLCGFDSFEGLPEDCTDRVPRGAFSTDGVAPDLRDPRIEWHPGWFADVLPSFEMPRHDRLFVNIDCDLYSSAATVLGWVVPHLVAGDFVYFDEFEDRSHEGRAFTEHLVRADVPLTCVAATRDLTHALFRVGDPADGSSDSG